MESNIRNLFSTPLYRSTLQMKLGVDADRQILDHVEVFIYDVLKVSAMNAPKITNSWIIDPLKGQLDYTPRASMISGLLRADNVQDSITVGLKRNHSFFDKSTEPQYTESTLYNSTITSVDLTGGDIVLFPSGLSHSVYPVSTDTNMHIVAFEIFLEGKRYARARSGGPYGGHIMSVSDGGSMWIED